MDALPKLICMDCQTKLEISYEFKKQCHQSEIKLNEISKADYEFNKMEPKPLDIENESIEVYQILDPASANVDSSLLESDTSSSNDEANTYKCNRCFKSYASKFSLIRHKAKGHPAECSRCCTEFENSEMLAKHMETHDADLTPFSCYVCKKGYHKKRSLKHHILTVSYYSTLLVEACLMAR